MTNLFKKSVIALALVGAAGVANAAVTVNGNPIGVSKQYEALTIDSRNITIKYAAGDQTAFAAGNKVVVTFNGAQLASAPATIQAAIVISGTGAPAAGSAGGSQNPVQITLTRDSVSANSATYIIGSAFTTPTGDQVATVTLHAATKTYFGPDAAAGGGDDVVITGTPFGLIASSVMASDAVTLDVAAASAAGVVISRATAEDSKTKTMFVVRNQFSTKFDGETSEAAGKVISKTINLAADRKAFTGTTNAEKFTFSSEFNTADVAFLDSNNTDVSTGALKATRGDVNYAISGDFSFIKDSDTATDGIQPAAGTVSATSTGGACKSIVVTAEKVTFTCDAATTKVTFAVDVRQGGSASPVSLADGSFKLTAEQKYTIGADTKSLLVVSDKAAGKFGNNGSSSFVTYLPYGADISQILYVTERAGVKDASIKASVRDGEGKLVLDSVELAKTTAFGVTQISNELKKALADKGITTGRFAVSIDVAAPNSAVFAAYNVGGDRLATSVK